MRLAREAIAHLAHRPAILRKDFTLDEYQILEARLHGADTVLLIVAMLPVSRLRALYAFAQSLGMEPLVEVNNAAEMRAALDLGAQVIGVNNRNLHNFDVDMNTTTRLADMVKGSGAILCALSGIWGAQDVRGYVEQGVEAVLVGESLMRAKDTRTFIRELLDLPADTCDSSSVQCPRMPFKKIDGVTLATIHNAQEANLIGIYLSPSHLKTITLREAGEVSSVLRQRRMGLEASPLAESHSAFTSNDRYFDAEGAGCRIPSWVAYSLSSASWTDRESSVWTRSYEPSMSRSSTPYNSVYPLRLNGRRASLH